MEKELTDRRPRVSPRVGVRALQKKNSELSQATKQLEEKMKTLQKRATNQNNTNTKNNQYHHRSLPKVRASSAPPRELPPAPKMISRRPSTASVASNVTSRLREREAEFQKQVKERDDHISRLKERLKALSKRLNEIKDGQKDVNKMANLENGVELQSIIKQVTKERLQLERHLQIANDSLQRNNGVDLQRVLELEHTNVQLRQQLDSLDLLQQEHKLVEIQYKEKEEACKELMNTLKYKSALCEDLETQLARVMEKNTELTMANSDLQKKVVKLKDVSEQCETLRSTLNKVEMEYTSAQSEVKSLSGKVRNLESVLAEMHKAAESRREIERQHKEALESLKRKQDEVDSVATKKQAELIDQLKVRIEELEREKQVQNEKHTELILEMAELKKYGPDSMHSEMMEQPADNLEIDEIMAKLEQDNKFLEDLEKQRAERKSAGNSPGNLQRSGSAITDSGFLSQSSLNGSSPNSRLGNNISHSTTSLNGSRSHHNLNGNGSRQSHNDASPANANGNDRSMSQSHGNLNKLPGMSKADKINLLNGTGRETGSATKVEEVSFEERDGMIEIPGKGWTFVFVARYSYDPFQNSPNDSPEAELQLNAGDYILVWGELDEDGFYDGELLDGRRGLVPSNFVEKLEGEDLIDFHQQVIMGLGGCDDSVCTSIPQDLDFLSSDEAEVTTTISRSKTVAQYFNTTRKNSAPNLPQYASCTDLDLTEDETDELRPVDTRSRPPHPRQLTVEAQQNKSLVIGWNPPDCPVNQLDSYQVLVDGNVIETLKATEKVLRATVNNFDASAVHRISVKSTSSANKSKASHESACTMVIGKEAPLAPTSLKATRITSTSCTVTWVPSNTNFMHSICINNIEVKTVKPGTFRHTLAGLMPNTSYKITIRAKNIKAAAHIVGGSLTQFQTLSSSLDIRTEPQGLPDPPMEVEVTKGPRDNTLLVSWLPVTINPAGTSNGAPVLGYVIYANGKRVKEIDCGTADQAVIDLGTSLMANTISVRTKSTNNTLSKESNPCLVSPSLRRVINNRSEDDDTDSDGDQLIEKLSKVRGFTNFTNNTRQQQQQQQQQLVQQQFMQPGFTGYTELIDSDIGPSELSDIAEEPEEGLTDNEDRDSLTPRNMDRLPSTSSSTRPISSFTPASLFNRNSLYTWPKLPPSGLMDSPSQFSAQPLTSTPSHRSEAISSSAAYMSNSATRPTIQISQSNQNTFTTTQSLTSAKKTSGKTRIFVALFDYDPQTMSPNPDASEEELPFREGQLIKIFGEKDSDGFYWGEAGDRTGYVPCNMVSEVQVDDDHVAEELLKDQVSKASRAKSPMKSTTTKTAISRDRWGDIYDDGMSSPKRKLALYDYDPTELSPNVDSEVELAFRTGDIIVVYGDMDDDGFFIGELNGKRGLVPSNFLTDVPPGYDPKQLIQMITANSNGKTALQHQPRILGLNKRW